MKQIKPLSVKLYALLPKPASVLNRKNQGKGEATVGELCPQNQKFKDFVRRSLAKAGIAHQSLAKVGYTACRNLDVDFEAQKCSRSAFLATFFAREKSGERKASRHAMAVSKMFRRRNDSGRQPQTPTSVIKKERKMTVCQFLTHGILFVS